MDQLLAILPILVFDKIKYGRVHRNYVFGLAVFLPWANPRTIVRAGMAMDLTTAGDQIEWIVSARV